MIEFVRFYGGRGPLNPRLKRVVQKREKLTLLMWDAEEDKPTKVYHNRMLPVVPLLDIFGFVENNCPCKRSDLLKASTKTYFTLLPIVTLMRKCSLCRYPYINIIWFCFDWFAMSNSCYNPFIYSIYNVSI